MKDSYSQIKDRHKYNYLQNKSLNRYYKQPILQTESEERISTKGKQNTNVVINNHKQKQFSLIIHEMKVKNHLLSQQLIEYRKMTDKMQKRIEQLTQQNCALKRQLSKSTTQHKNKINHHHDLSSFHSSQQNRMKEISPNIYNPQNFASSLLQQLVQFLTKGRQSKTIVKNRYQLHEKLAKIARQYKQMQQFILQIWQLKDQIQYQGDSLADLARWVNKIAKNYKELLVYRSKSCQKSNKGKR